MGLAGTLQRERYEKFIQLIPTSIKAIVVPDGHAQLLGASNSEAGICLSLGTGSVIHWLDTSGKFGKAGGWGFPIGDEASGAWLGAQLVNEYIWYRDKNLNSATAPTIFIDLEQRIGKSVSDIQVWSTMTRSTQLASLAPIVTKHADTGDPIAIKLLDRGAGHCQQLIDIAPTELPLYVVGGLADVYLPRLKTRYAERCQPATGNALSGLYALSKSNSVSELSSKPS